MRLESSSDTWALMPGGIMLQGIIRRCGKTSRRDPPHSGSSDLRADFTYGSIMVWELKPNWAADLGL